MKDDWRTSAIERHAKGDAEKAKRIAEAMKELSGAETDRPAIEAKVAKAAKLAREDVEIDRVATAFGGFSGAAPEKPAEKGFGETEDGLSLASRLGLNIAKKK